MKEQLTLNGLDFSPEENLSRYLQSIKKFPILSSEEEYDLALRYQQSKDKEIAYKLITHICGWWLRLFQNTGAMVCLSAK